MSRKYKVRDNTKLYFVTTTIVNWIDVFTRRHYKDIVVDSLRHCIREKGLEVYAYCLMTNHIHVIVGTHKNPIDAIMRDMKRHTAKALYEAIDQDVMESRRDWLLWFFQRAGRQNSSNNGYQIWQQGFHPIELSSNEAIDQKVEYIHQNPVKAGFVDEPEHYLYSSASNYSGSPGLLPVILLY
ncbi:REP-associated tyrosine transposase [Fibrella aquatica]|uniref:REP-associated tyrosine transposase n=1 Tax=Fibrella aquatica TaxID=3242487 RepID=UPI00352310EE